MPEEEKPKVRILKETDDEYHIAVPKIKPSTKAMTLVASSGGWKNTDWESPAGTPLRINAMIGYYPEKR
jgi:hypothetical protein